MSSSRKAVVYTDGSCRGNGQGGARGGIGVYWGEGDSRLVECSFTLIELSHFMVVQPEIDRRAEKWKTHYFC